MSEALLTSILSDNLRSINYFNGRVLTAEDMRVEQSMQRHRDELLGCAIGEGVVKGLEVQAASGAEPAVTVKPGLGINRKGQALVLEREVTVRIVAQDESAAVGEALFVPCPEASGSTALPAGTGAYLLVASPAAEVREQALRVGLADNGVARTCESKYVVEGVQFRLVQLDMEDSQLLPEPLFGMVEDLVPIALPTAAQTSRLQNVLAHWCLGTRSASLTGADLFSEITGAVETPNPDPVEYLRRRADAGGLTDCDLPLALLYWTRDGIGFVDKWAVRRRLHRRSTNLAHSALGVDGRTAVAEASVLQFLDQIAAIAKPGTSQTALAQVRVQEYFAFLPPIGMIPERVGVALGFTHLEFFADTTIREPFFIDGARAQSLFRIATGFPPVELSEREFFWLYRVRQNRQQPGAQAFLLFTTGFAPFQGDAQYDLARWAFSNYGPGVNPFTAFTL